MPSRSRQARQQRLLVNGQQTNDPALLEAEEVNLHPEHRDGIHETENHKRKVETMQGYRRRIERICEFFIGHYPEYAVSGVRLLTDDDKIEGPNQHHYNNTYDLVYQGINLNLVKAFLSEAKKKENGKFSSHEHIRKYHDAILFGAEEAGVVLGEGYRSGMDIFLNSYKKELAKQRQKGNVDKQEADHISFSLYRLLRQWFLKTGNIFGWLFLVMQWNCMARSISIDCLGFHNLSCGVDSIKVKYDTNKSDRSGESCTEKNCYANPFDGCNNKCPC
jgi:hypothetical protein